MHRKMLLPTSSTQSTLGGGGGRLHNTVALPNFKPAWLTKLVEYFCIRLKLTIF